MNAIVYEQCSNCLESKPRNEFSTYGKYNKKCKDCCRDLKGSIILAVNFGTHWQIVGRAGRNLKFKTSEDVHTYARNRWNNFIFKIFERIEDAGRG